MKKPENEKKYLIGIDDGFARKVVFINRQAFPDRNLSKIMPYVEQTGNEEKFLGFYALHQQFIHIWIISTKFNGMVSTVTKVLFMRSMNAAIRTLLFIVTYASLMNTKLALQLANL